MKPAWDKLGETFKYSASVLIADVDCTSDGAKAVCADNGVSGYPTIKYFTTETGKNGEIYDGGRNFMDLEDFTKQKLVRNCNPKTKEDCTDNEKAYVDKMVSFGADKVATEVARLKGMEGGDMKTDKKVWLLQRIAILDRLVSDGKGEL